MANFPKRSGERRLGVAATTKTRGGKKETDRQSEVTEKSSVPIRSQVAGKYVVGGSQLKSKEKLDGQEECADPEEGCLLNGSVRARLLKPKVITSSVKKGGTRV